MNERKETDREIDKFLANEEQSLGDEFANNVLTKFNCLEESVKSQRKQTSFYTVLIGMAACYILFLILSNPQNNKDFHFENIAINRETMELLGEEEKEIIEDFMTIPDGVLDSDILFSEETYDLLVLLDQ